MEFLRYRLPDGREVNVDATAAKGAAEITFQLKGGEVVLAVLEGEIAHPDTDDHLAWCVPCGEAYQRRLWPDPRRI